jgi:membrane protease YdiL (CAAX protease family)
LTWQRVPVGEMQIKQPGAETTALAVFSVLYILLSLATGFIIRHHPVPFLDAVGFANDATYIFGFKVGALLVLPATAFYCRGYRAADLLPRLRSPAHTAAFAMLGFVIGSLPNLQYLRSIGSALSTLSEARGTSLMVVGGLLPLLAAAIPEEFVYRGLLQTRLEKTLGRLPAILLTAILFTAWHLPTRFLLSQGVEGRAGDFQSVLVGTGMPVLIVALVFGWLWDRYRNLPFLIAMHWGMDFLPSAASCLGIRS